jgi:histidine phosphotransfer protein HptB
VTIDETTFRGLQDAAGAEFVRELVATFLAEAPRMHDELRSALEAGSVERFRRAAHSLKSNSLTFGALGLGALARELEIGAKDAVAGSDAAKLDALLAEYARAAARLEELARG